MKIHYDVLDTPFVQGQEAFKRGQPDSVCPYPKSIDSKNPSTDGPKRKEWMDGYYTARTKKNVGHILRKYK